MERIPAHVAGIVAGIRAIGMEPPEAVAQAERTREKLAEEMARAQQALSEVDPGTLRTRFADEAFAAADSDKPLPDYAEELARLEAQLRWRRIAVDALSDAANRAAYQLQATIGDELPAVYDMLRTALSDALSKVRQVGPAMASMPLDAAEQILRSGDRKAVSAYADLADASDVIGHVRTVQRHLRTLQGAASDGSERWDHYEDPNVATRAPKHRLEYVLWLATDPEARPVVRTVNDSRVKEQEVIEANKARNWNRRSDGVYMPPPIG